MHEYLRCHASTPLSSTSSTYPYKASAEVGVNEPQWGHSLDGRLWDDCVEEEPSVVPTSLAQAGQCHSPSGTSVCIVTLHSGAGRRFWDGNYSVLGYWNE